MLAKYIKHASVKKLTPKKRNEYFALNNEVKVLQKHRTGEKVVADLLHRIALDQCEAVGEGFTIGTEQAARPELAWPQSTMSTVRELADRIGFAVFPLTYLSESFLPSRYEQRQAWDAVQQVEWWDSRRVYVMAPVTAYSLDRHLDNEDAPIYVPEDAAQAFLALQMSIPVLRQIRRHIKELQRSVSEMRADIDSLNHRLGQLAEQIARQRAESERLRRKVQIDKIEAALHTWYVDGGDPLLLVIPWPLSRESDFRANVRVLVGPSWGELPPVVASMLGPTPRRR